MEASARGIGGGEVQPERRRRRALAGRAPASLVALGILAGLLAVLPAVYLAIVDLGDIGRALDSAFSSRVAGILGRTLALVAAVVATSIALAVPLGWLTVRSDLPGRRLWTTLVTLPLVIPTYVGAYLFIAALGPEGLLADAIGADSLPSVYGFPGAWIVLTLFTYPLVLIPVRGTLKRLDPQLEEAARGMGRSPREVFRTIVMPQLWPPIAVGALLVALFSLSDFGAVSLLRFDSFTAEIYTAYSAAFDRVETAALGTVLVVLMLIGLWASAKLRDRHALHRLGPGSARPATPVALGRWRWPALAFCASVTTIALVLPVGVLVYWATQGLNDGSITFGAVAAFAGNSLLTGFWAALIATAAALCIAVLAGRFPSPLTRLIERCGYAGYALPGVIVALAMVYLATRHVPSVYQTITLLIFALTIHYLPLAIASIGAALSQVSPRVEEAARGLGRGPMATLRTVTVPLVRGGIVAGAALVFLNALKELPATLILAPTGFDTLATDIFRQTEFGFYEASAIPALVLLAIAAPPLYLLSERGTVAA